MNQSKFGKMWNHLVPHTYANFGVCNSCFCDVLLEWIHLNWLVVPTHLYLQKFHLFFNPPNSCPNSFILPAQCFTPEYELWKNLCLSQIGWHFKSFIFQLQKKLFHLTEKQAFDLQIKLGNSAIKPISDPKHLFSAEKANSNMAFQFIQSKQHW
jgi:hypothetical protein